MILYNSRLRRVGVLAWKGHEIFWVGRDRKKR
jgi:hypothetical protein